MGAGPSHRLADCDSIEAQALARAASLLVPTRVALPGDVAAEDATSGALVIVRTAAPAEPPFFAVLARDVSDAALARAAGGLFAEAVLGVSPSRFLATLPNDAGAEEVEQALGRLAAASPLGALPPFEERTALLVERARAKSKGATVFVQTLDPGARFGHVVTRDLRTGQGPPRGQLDASPRALIETVVSLVPLADVAGLPAEARAELEELAAKIESDLKQPARIAFELGSGGPRLVAVTPLRHSGRAAIALATALVESGRLDAAAALEAVKPADVTSALQLRLDPDPSSIVGRGVAAGGGVAVGHACLAPARAASLAAAGMAPLLFVEELVAEDSSALAASRGVVTIRGGITGEAAIMARALAKPCVASGPSLTLAGGAAVSASGVRIEVGDPVAIDGSTGLIVRGACKRVCEVPTDVATVLSWTIGLSSALVAGVVEHEYDATLALELGADALAILVPAALGAEPEERARRLSRIFEIAGSRAVFVANAGPSPAGATPIVLGAPGAPVLWRQPGPEAEPAESFVAWAEPATLEAVALRVVRREGCAIACAPEQVPATRLALARASVTRQ